MINYFSILLLSLLLLSSCRKDFRYNNNNEQHVNVMCFLKADDTVRVNLSYTIEPYQFTTDYNNYIKNADVYLYENNELKEKLVPTENTFSDGWYKSNTFLPEQGKEYKLVVVVSNFDTIFAETTIPYKILIDTVKYYSELKEDEYGDSILSFDFNLSLEDPEIKNYYCFELNYLFTTNDPIIDTKNNNEYFINNIDDIKAIFSDSTFNGLTYILNYNHSSYMDNTDTFEFSNELSTLSDEAYLFYKTSYIQYINRENPLVEPVIIYSNITNGTGIFAGLSSDTDTIIFIKNKKKIQMKVFQSASKNNFYK